MWKFLFFFFKKNGTVGSWTNGNDRSLATDMLHHCKSPGDGPERSDRIFYSSPYLFAWGIFCLSCCITGCYDDEGNSWKLHGSSSSLPHRPIKEVDFGAHRLCVDGGLHLGSVQFCDAPSRSVLMCVVRCYWHPVLAVELRVRGIWRVRYIGLICTPDKSGLEPETTRSEVQNIFVR